MSTRSLGPGGPGLSRALAPAVACALAIASACGPRDKATEHRRDVLTGHNDSARSGATLDETRLSPAAVASGAFRRLYERSVDGGVVAQPLYIEDVVTHEYGRRNLLLVATDTNWVYAFDADADEQRPSGPSDAGDKPLFARQLALAGPVRPALCGETPSERVGIAATPVVDRGRGALYVIARDANDSQYYLFALNLATGLTDRTQPIVIAATERTRGIPFQAECQRNRPALLLAGGAVYAAFGSLACGGDCPGGAPYHGWVVGYTAEELVPVAVFCTSPESGHAGIGQAGSGLAGAGDRIFFQTGDGSGPLGNAFVGLRRMDSPPGLALAGAFQPARHPIAERADTERGPGGVVWLPPGRVVGGGRDGRYDVLDADTLSSVQNRPEPPTPRESGSNANAGPVYWPLADRDYGLLYQISGRGFLKAFRYDARTQILEDEPAVVSAVRVAEGMWGGVASLSTNRDRDGILWVSYPLGNARGQGVPGRLAAFDARSLRELWHDDGGYLFAEFTPPTIANGKVVRATLSGRVVVYGLRPTSSSDPWWRRAWTRVAGVLGLRP